MADEERNLRSLNRDLSSLNSRLDDLFKDTYTVDPNQRSMFDTMTSDIAKSVTNILSTSSDIQNMPDISQLYARIEKRNGNRAQLDKFYNSLSDMFDDSNLLNTMMANPEINRYIKSKDFQTDMILKYMPKLKTALEIKKDNVLSAENFSKSFLRILNNSTSLDNDDVDVFSMQAKQVIDKYHLEEEFEDIYDKTAEYGEQFIYCVPYKNAFERVMKGHDGRSITPAGIPTLNLPMTEAVIFESGKIDEVDKDFFNKTEEGKQTIEALKECTTKVTLTFNDSYVLADEVKNAYKARESLKWAQSKSVNESFLQEANVLRKGNKVVDLANSGEAIESDKNNPRKSKYKMDRTTPDDLQYSKLYDKANDGLMADTNAAMNNTKIDDIPGCIFKRLKRCDTIPIYIEGVYMGCYYFEFSYISSEDIERSRLLLNDTLQAVNTREMKDENDLVIKYLAAKISSQIDSHFINANQDLKNEIYAILKYDKRFNNTVDQNNIQITYLPPTDVYHFYFKRDEELNRGISDLEDSLFPALFWVLITLSTTMGLATRANDHRVFYVRQNVETNIAKTLMNVINQLKKGNMGIRQMQSMNNILGVIGKYNDYIIPVGPSGDAPVTFDTIQGQDIKTPEELLNKFEEQAIDATDVPMELVNAVMNVDYATRFTMANSKFLRKVLKRQEICEKRFTDLFSMVYNYEYQTNEKLIEVKLPEPIFLTTVNGLAMMNNVRDYVNAIAEIQYPQNAEKTDENDKAEFIKRYSERMLSTYLDIKLIHSIMEEIDLAKFDNESIIANATNENNNDNEDEGAGEEF